VKLNLFKITGTRFVPRPFFCLLLLTTLLLSATAQAGFIDHFARPDDIGRYKVPRFGHSRVLVIPVNVATATRKRLDLNALREFYSGKLEGFTFANYWYTQSGGRLLIDADVIDPIEYENCPFPDPDGECTPARRNAAAFLYAAPVLAEVLKRAKEEQNIDFSRYDLNGSNGTPDGWSDGVLMVVNFGWFGVALPFGLVSEKLIREYDGVKIPIVAISGGPNAVYMSLHEYGHLIGFADLYDEWRITYGLQFSPMGSWHYDRWVPALDAPSRYLAGWADVVQVQGTVQELIPPVAESGRIYKLGAGREFFLLENRARSGPFDTQFTEPGLAIYHVNMQRRPTGGDDDFYGVVVDCPNCSRWRPFLMNEQADGRFDVQYRLIPGQKSDLFRSGSAFLPGPYRGKLSASNVYFNSNYYGGRASEIAVYDIDADSYAPYVKAILKAPPPISPCADLLCPPDRICREGRCVAGKPLLENEPVVNMCASVNKEAQNKPMEKPVFAIGSEDKSKEKQSVEQYLDPSLDWRIIAVLVFVLWMIIRKPLRRRIEGRNKSNSEKTEEK